MGYYSEVKIAMRESDYIELLNRVNYYTNKDVLSIFVKDMCSTKTVTNNGQKVVILHWDWVKWYQEFKEVQYIEEYIAELNEQCKPYKFVRIGEDSSDIEVLDSWGEDEDDCCDIIRAEVYTEIVEEYNE